MSILALKFLLTRHAICDLLFQEGSITQVACCPHDEDFIAVATRSEFVHEVNKSFVLFFEKSHPPLIILLCVWLCFPYHSLSSSQGLVVVWELQFERRGRPERVSVSWEHRGQNITALCWDTSILRVFVGDSGGKVSFLRAGSSKLGKVITAEHQ